MYQSKLQLTLPFLPSSLCGVNIVLFFLSVSRMDLDPRGLSVHGHGQRRRSWRVRVHATQQLRQHGAIRGDEREATGQCAVQSVEVLYII